MTRIEPRTLRAFAPLAAAWGFLLVLRLAGTRLPLLPPWAVVALLVALAALPAWGLWLAFMIRKRVLFLQFARGGWVRRWFSGGLWPAAKAAPAALALATVALWQAWFLAPREWLLLTAAPLVYLALMHGLRAGLARQFARPAFAWPVTQRASRWIFMVLVGAAWLAMMLHGALDARVAHPAMSAPALDQAIADIAAARSGLVRWGLDGLLALQVVSAAVRELPQSAALRVVLLALAGPGAMLWCLARVMQGASGLDRGLLRAALPRRASGIGSRAVLPAFLGVLVLMIALGLFSALEGLARDHGSPLALEPLPQCERIAGDYYTVGTALELRQLLQRTLGQTRAGAAFCEQAQDTQGALDAALDHYLDWYFSLGAEWGRIFHLLAGDADAFLTQRLKDTLEKTPELDAWLLAVRTREAEIQAALMHGEQRVQQTLQAHHLVLDTGRCLVQAELDALPELTMLTTVRQRAAASTAAGLGAGAFAGAVAAKAMSKAGMKAAAKVLAKAAAKQGLGKGGAVIAGAALGSIVPGTGTAAGAVAGLALGALVGTGLDWTALRLEEHVTREGMKAELQAALQEHLDTLAGAMGCAAGDPEPGSLPTANH